MLLGVACPPDAALGVSLVNEKNTIPSRRLLSLFSDGFVSHGGQKGDDIGY
jgi:hypothetical protein